LQLCPDIVFAATPPYDGTLAKYYRVPADLAYSLPDNVSLEDGALVSIVHFLTARFANKKNDFFRSQMEPLSVGIHSVSNLGGLRANQNIAVFGCGPIGLLAMAVAKALGS
jgi:D-xylulose reductase